MGFQNSSTGPTKVNGVQITQSKQGYPLTVVMGANKVPQSLIWLDSLTSQEVSSSTGGGGKGSGKGGDEYLYSADVITALCAGPVSAIGNVWSGQTWLASSYGNTTHTLTSSSYTPSGNLTGDNGVGINTNYSGTYNDYGSYGTTLSGSNYSSMNSVPYSSGGQGGLATGQYTYNPATGTYYFSGADVAAGATVQMSYSYSLTQFMQTEVDLIGASPIYPGGSNGPQVDYGVVYYNNGNSLDGEALTAVEGTPTETGTYSFTSNNSSAPEYKFASGDIGNEVLITWSYTNTNAVQPSAPTTLNYELYGGGAGQSPAPYVSSSESLAYPGIAYLLFSPMSLGTSAEIQDNVFEVITPDGFGAGVIDCNPVACISKVLTNTQWGLGSGLVPFPTSVIDSVTWGTPGTAGTQSANSTAWNWFAAQSFFISPIIDSQDTAASTMGKWLEAGMCAAFMSEGLLKLVPYGDTSAAANGCTWIAPAESIVSLDDTCFIGKEGEDPVKIERSAWQDASNKVQVQFKNRSNQYCDEIVSESDQAAINRYGLRVEDAQDWDFICTLPAATFAASMRVKRSVNIRNTYTFSVPYTYSYLEPLDIINITTSSLWSANSNNVNLDIVTLPVRITKIVDDPKNGLEITCEDYLWGVHQPSIYNKGISTGTTLLNAYSQPGNSEVVMFEATSALTRYQGNQIWIGASGPSSDWGACNVWVSQDNTKYLQIGSIPNAARMGTLTSALAVTSDPDTTASLVVELVDNSAPLESGTHLDADSGNTMCYVDGEIISYSTCALTGNNTYTMSGYLRRGQMSSTIGAHAAGSLFMRLDSSVLKYTYDPSWVSKTLYFKYQSVNWVGNCAQDLSTLGTVTFTVPGLNPGTVSASTGLIEQGALVGNGTSTLLNGQGSIIPNENVVYTTSYSSSSVGVSVAAQSLLRADGSTQTVNAASLSYTGLSAYTTYHLYPYVSVASGNLMATNGNPPPTVANATMALQAAADGRISLGAVTITTSASGGGTGGGSGGISCPESQEIVCERDRGKIAAGDVVVGNYILGHSFTTGEDVYRRVIHIRKETCYAWRVIGGHKNSPCESVHYNEQWMPAFMVPSASFNGDKGTKVMITVEAGIDNDHNYYIGDLLIHNQSINS
jgi:hypothetical protein